MTNCVLIQTRFLTSLNTLVDEYKIAVASSVASKGFKMSKKVSPPPPLGTATAGREDWDLQTGAEPNQTHFPGTTPGDIVYKKFGNKIDDDKFVGAQVDRAMMLYFFGVEPSNKTFENPALPTTKVKPADRRVLTGGAVSTAASRVNVGVGTGVTAVPLDGSSPQALLNFIYFQGGLIDTTNVRYQNKSISDFMLYIISKLGDDILKKPVMGLLGKSAPVLDVLPFNDPNQSGAPPNYVYTNTNVNLDATGVALGKDNIPV